MDGTAIYFHYCMRDIHQPSAAGSEQTVGCGCATRCQSLINLCRHQSGHGDDRVLDVAVPLSNPMKREISLHA